MKERPAQRIRDGGWGPHGRSACFCALPPAACDDYVRAVLRWRRPGGHYLAVNYLRTDPDGPPWPTTREE